MTISDSPEPYAEPHATRVPDVRGRALASAVAVFLGGYILVQSLSSQLAAALGGISGARDFIVVLVGQLIVGLAAVIVGFFLAPATAGRKALASAIVLVAVGVSAAAQAARITAHFGAIAGSITLANAYFMVALSVGAGWLIVRSARLGWLALLAALALIPLPYLFVVNGIGSALTQVMLLIAFGIVGTVILVAGRPAR